MTYGATPTLIVGMALKHFPISYFGTSRISNSECVTRQSSSI
jgi:hypothetical protein